MLQEEDLTLLTALNLGLGRMWTRSTITTIGWTLCYVALLCSSCGAALACDAIAVKALNREADKRQSCGYFATAD